MKKKYTAPWLATVIINPTTLCGSDGQMEMSDNGVDGASALFRKHDLVRWEDETDED